MEILLGNFPMRLVLGGQPNIVASASDAHWHILSNLISEISF